jgi:hypothetical protein
VHASTGILEKDATMKVSKRQLRRIIREEKAKIVQENRIRRAVRKLLESSVQQKFRPSYPAGYRFETLMAPAAVDKREQVNLAKGAGLEVRGEYVIGTAEQLDEFGRMQHDLIVRTSSDPYEREDAADDGYESWMMFQDVLPAGYDSGTAEEKAQAQADFDRYEGM